MTNTLFIELLEKLPFYHRREVYQFMEFLHQKAQEEPEELTDDEMAELKRRIAAYMKNPKSGLSLEESKKQLLAKYGL